MKNFIVYDCEVRKSPEEHGWDDVYNLEMSTGVAWNYDTNKYHLFFNKYELCKLLNGKTAVSFNGIMFDSLLLLGNNRILEKNGITKNDTYWWYNCDVYVEMWRHIFNMSRENYIDITNKIKETKTQKNIFNLDSIVRSTLNISKCGSGATAPKLWELKKIDKLFEYNIQDVFVLKELFEFIRSNKYLVTGSYDVVKF